jgi:hypothetical protein
MLLMGSKCILDGIPMANLLVGLLMNYSLARVIANLWLLLRHLICNKLRKANSHVKPLNNCTHHKHLDTSLHPQSTGRHALAHQRIVTVSEACSSHILRVAEEHHL